MNGGLDFRNLTDDTLSLLINLDPLQWIACAGPSPEAQTHHVLVIFRILVDLAGLEKAAWGQGH